MTIGTQFNSVAYSFHAHFTKAMSFTYLPSFAFIINLFFLLSIRTTGEGRISIQLYLIPVLSLHNVG